MKKVITMALALLLLMSLAACGKTQMPSVRTNQQIVAEYVETNGDELLAGLEEGFTEGSNMTCRTSIQAMQCDIYVTICINELYDVSAEDKASMQAAYDSIQSTWDEALADLQKDVPQIEHLIISVRDRDDNSLAQIRAGY